MFCENVPIPVGRIRLYEVDAVRRQLDFLEGLSLWDPQTQRPIGWQRKTDWIPNNLLYEWGAIFGNLLLRKGLQYGIGGMYVEFENVLNHGDVVSAPSFTRDPEEGISYYDNLAGSSNRDYLRIPLTAGILNTSDQRNFPKGNAPTFFAMTSGIAGVHGKPFSEADNSVIFGAALVSFVDEDDFTKDLVLSRAYVPDAQQQAKLATSQVGVEWELRCG